MDGWLGREGKRRRKKERENERKGEIGWKRNNSVM